MARGLPAAWEPAVLFLLANTVRQLVGISVGIGSNRWIKLFQIQLVMVLGDCRPGAPEYLHIATHTGSQVLVLQGFSELFPAHDDP